MRTLNVEKTRGNAITFSKTGKMTYNVGTISQLTDKLTESAEEPKKEIWRAVEIEIDGIMKTVGVSNLGHYRDLDTGKMYEAEFTGKKVRANIYCPQTRKVKHIPLHRLVIMAFAGMPEEDLDGYDVHHRDGDCTNNAITNLCLMRHKTHLQVETEYMNRGLKQRQYSDNQKMSIMEMIKKGMSTTAIETRTGISYITINNLRTQIG